VTEFGVPGFRLDASAARFGVSWLGDRVSDGGGERLGIRSDVHVGPVFLELGERRTDNRETGGEVLLELDGVAGLDPVRTIPRHDENVAGGGVSGNVLVGLAAEQMDVRFAAPARGKLASADEQKGAVGEGAGDGPKEVRVEGVGVDAADETDARTR